MGLLEALSIVGNSPESPSQEAWFIKAQASAHPTY